MKLKEIPGDSEVVYDSKKVKMYFDKKDVISYCKKILQEYNHLNDRKDLLTFLENSTQQQIIISDSIVTKPDTSQIIDRGKGHYKDTITKIPDSWSLQTQLAKAMKWAAIEILEKGRARIFDMQNKKFVDFIIIDNDYDEIAEEVKIYLPNDTLILSALVRIK